MGTKQRDNPFRHRWRLDDPQWMRQRKKDWSKIKDSIVENERITTKQLKYFKDFYVEGVEPPPYFGERIIHTGFHAHHRLLLTPHYDEADVREVFEYLGPTTFETLLAQVAFGQNFYLNNPSIEENEQIKLIVRALILDEYREETVSHGGNTWRKYIPAARFIKEFEYRSYSFLTDVTSSPQRSIQHTTAHYLSCIRHLEAQGEVEHHPWFRNLLSCVFNFVEPRASVGQASTASRFAAELAARLGAADAPASVRAAIAALGPHRLFEYSRAERYVYKSTDTAAESTALFGGHQRLATDWAAPGPRVLHGLVPDAALKVIVRSAERAGLWPEGAALPPLEAVDVAPLLSAPFIADKLGLDPDGPVPAWRMTLWYRPDVRIANGDDARFGADLFLFVGPGVGQGKESPALLYYPRLSEYYRDWYPTEALFLKERQHRQDIFEQCGEYLLWYSDDEPEPPDYESPWFINDPTVAVGYFLLRDFKSGSVELALDGPDVTPWQGAPLPPLKL